MEHSCVLKYHRASKHLKDLESNFRHWVNDGHYTQWLELDPSASDYLLVKASAEEIPANPFSLLIGDVVQNFRNALDHLAFALASAYTKPLPEEFQRDSQFPIVGDMDRKGNTGQGSVVFQSVRKSIAGIDPSAQTVIEGLQP